MAALMRANPIGPSPEEEIPGTSTKKISSDLRQTSSQVACRRIVYLLKLQRSAYSSADSRCTCMMARGSRVCCCSMLSRGLVILTSPESDLLCCRPLAAQLNSFACAEGVTHAYGDRDNVKMTTAMIATDAGVVGLTQRHDMALCISYPIVDMLVTDHAPKLSLATVPCFTGLEPNSQLRR
jgi:hypothetical protein